MNSTPMLVLAIVGSVLTWTSTVAVLATWLAGKFRQLEILIYREQNKHDVKYMALFKEQSDRLTVLELQVTGVSQVVGPVFPPKPNRY